MTYKFKKDRSFEYRFKERQKLIAPFIQKYKSPVIVHAIDNTKTFKKIIGEGGLKTPKEHDGKKKTPYMEKFLGFDNRIFFSLGFFYTTAYDFKYCLIFSLDMLKNLEYYRKSISWQPYKKVVDFWHEKDPTYLERLARSSKVARGVINRYHNEEVNGKKRTILDFWKIEEELFRAIRKYKDFNKLNRLIKKTVKDLKLIYPDSKKDALKAINNYRGTPEILSNKSIELPNNKNFLGFYIKGKTSKRTLDLLKKEYPDKILFNGKKIKKIGDIK
ncbi:MAG: hypothetical protein KJ718_01600 [Nanoarchaeota archaeon]|nr:hypothetical protein [Nanoarchaeota archaeon]MBU1051229.1 hypothetical protein [Nanoarchaeota archaeon]MBU1988539.1 hypothetical protein [Nanoarchaeota archaeon]